ncbi:hypothetical protein, partial [Streptomyces cavernae]|uniref:hypothetical protein n=1 Tax=Streptomyces cavernae TaxID=2259034 RepID=UPI001EE3EF19
MVAQVFQVGSDLLDEGSHLVLSDAEQVSGAGQAALVEDGGPDDVLRGHLAVPGPLLGRESVEAFADVGG